ncbi:MAG: NUDIX domain-containing protein [Anaerolineae bacterium]
MKHKAYRAAGGVVVDAATGQVLLLRRPARLGPDSQPEVRLPKGHVEKGERALEAALREVAEEAGLAEVEPVADLGTQRVEFDFEGSHYRRDERYFLLRLPEGAARGAPEAQFARLWASWSAALEAITFEAEREWLRRGRQAWQSLSDG